VILAGRRINDSMAGYVTDQVIELMTRRKMQVVDSRILGLTFKEGCPDLRNTKVIDIVRELTSYPAHVDIYDPWIRPGRPGRGNCALPGAPKQTPAGRGFA
jgi:UDP-N-acetyl-D-galactosamine dehydrogenase